MFVYVCVGLIKNNKYFRSFCASVFSYFKKLLEHIFRYDVLNFFSDTVLFFTKNHEQAIWCKQEYYHGAVSSSGFTRIVGDFVNHLT